MLKTMIAVEDFFGPLQLLQGDKVRGRNVLKNYLYDNAQYFRRGVPKLQVFYATAGIWKDDQNLTSLITQSKDKLLSMGLFSDVQFKPIDAARLQNLYFRTKNAVRQQIVFDKSVTLPPIGDVKEAHIGVVSITEYLKLIVDENGALRKQLFFDNMRDYMEDSDINQEIQATLLSSRSSEFPLRNNGITIVARKLQRVGNQFDIEDYQIVNGCQTSHVIYNARNEEAYPVDSGSAICSV
jgi:AIPR protein